MGCTWRIRTGGSLNFLTLDGEEAGRFEGVSCRWTFYSKSRTFFLRLYHDAMLYFTMISGMVFI